MRDRYNITRSLQKRVSTKNLDLPAGVCFFFLYKKDVPKNDSGTSYGIYS